jgi:nucleotide-binding universal stress UspA family protein
MFAIHRILHPTDFSEYSEAAFRLACALARDHAAQVVVLHVVPPPVCRGEAVARRQPNGYHEQLWDHLHRVQPPEPGVRIERLLTDGNPGEEILRVAAEIPCDLIVMGTHGRRGLARLLLGSVAEHVLRGAPCPVLTVNTPAPQCPAVEGAVPEHAGTTPEGATA